MIINQTNKQTNKTKQTKKGSEIDNQFTSDNIHLADHFASVYLDSTVITSDYEYHYGLRLESFTIKIPEKLCHITQNSGYSLHLPTSSSLHLNDSIYELKNISKNVHSSFNYKIFHIYIYIYKYIYLRYIIY